MSTTTKDPHSFTEYVIEPTKNEDGKLKAITWRDVKAFCDSLSDDDLAQEVIIWGDNYAKPVHSIERTTQDLVNPSGEGLEPVSAYVGEHRLDSSQDEDEFTDEPIVVYAGAIRLECLS